MKVEMWKVKILNVQCTWKNMQKLRKNVRHENISKNMKKRWKWKCKKVKVKILRVKIGRGEPAQEVKDNTCYRLIDIVDIVYVWKLGKHVKMWKLKVQTWK